MHLKNRIKIHVYGPCLFYWSFGRRKVLFTLISFINWLFMNFIKESRGPFYPFYHLFLIGGRRDCMRNCGVWGVPHQIRGGVWDTLQGEVLYRVWARVHYRWVYRVRSVSSNTVRVGVRDSLQGEVLYRVWAKCTTGRCFQVEEFFIKNKEE
jgi:hypothetical protein